MISYVHARFADIYQQASVETIKLVALYPNHEPVICCQWLDYLIEIGAVGALVASLRWHFLRIRPAR